MSLILKGNKISVTVEVYTALTNILVIYMVAQKSKPL